MKKSPETDMDTGDLPARLDPVQLERLPSPAGSFDAIARYAPPAAGAPQDGDVLADLRRYLSAVWRYKWAVTGITVLGTAAGVAGKMLLPPNYVARATVWIQVPARPTRDEGPIWSGQLPISSGWTDLLHTNVVLEEVVRQQRLYVAPQEPRDSDALAGFGIKDRVRGGTYRLVVNDGGTAFTLEEMKAGMLQHGVTGDSGGAEHAVPPRSRVRRIARHEGEPRAAAARPRGDRPHPRPGTRLRARRRRARHDRLGGEVHRAEPGAARSHRQGGGAARAARPLHRRQRGGAPGERRGSGARAADASGARDQAHPRAGGAGSGAGAARGLGSGRAAAHPTARGRGDAAAAQRDAGGAGGHQPAAAL